ncbi:unnamed protein product [Blepharisma stoltei]|uniref:Uncharacterized protein n=1 Tax=Blepharisma stoltei TaxID=1481888 RepID=A0AAU9K2Q5_9CILI|nr:unnamed protein product [Blepharisma stoltei]
MFTGGVNWWPHLLSLLNWIVNQLKCTSQSEEIRDLGDFDEFFTDFCYRDYDRFLNDELRLDFAIEWTELQEESSRNYNKRRLAYEAKIKDLEREFQSNYDVILKQREAELQNSEKSFDLELKQFGNEGEKKRKLETKIKNSWYALERKLMSPAVDELVCSNLNKIQLEYENKYKTLSEQNEIVYQELQKKQEELAKLKNIEQLDSIKLGKECENVQEEIDLLRREFIISQEEIEVIDDEIGNLKNKIKENERESKTEIMKIKGLIKNDIQFIIKHAKIIRQWLEDAQ